MAEVLQVQSLDRALDIVEVLCRTKHGMAIRELTEATGLNKSTVYRMLQTLRRRGYVMQDEDTGRYAMTTRLYDLGNQVVRRMDILEASRRPMERLCAAVGETVHLVIPEETEMVYLHKVEPEGSSIRMASRIGMHRPMYCTASGKAILACYSAERVEQLWHASTIVAYTPHTFTDLAAFQGELALIRRRGAAFDWEENELGIRCVAAAIRGCRGKVQGAISISVPQQHAAYCQMESLLEQLFAARSQIAAQMGEPGLG